jgi:hypothetical protein
LNWRALIFIEKSKEFPVKILVLSGDQKRQDVGLSSGVSSSRLLWFIMNITEIILTSGCTCFLNMIFDHILKGVGRHGGE